MLYVGLTLVDVRRTNTCANQRLLSFNITSGQGSARNRPNRGPSDPQPRSRPRCVEGVSAQAAWLPKEPDHRSELELAPDGRRWRLAERRPPFARPGSTKRGGRLPTHAPRPRRPAP